MDQSSSHAYPLPFPNEIHQAPFRVSTYSSLANALGTESDYSLYLNGPPVNNPSYPYPARNVVNPGTFPARTPLSASNGRRPSNPGIVYEAWELKGQPKMPSKYELLPQPSHVESYKAPNCYQAGVEFPGIYFQPKNDKVRYSVGDLLDMGTLPDLVGGDDLVFLHSPDRYIKIKILWPGYSRYPFEKRLNVKQDPPLTTTILLMTLSYYLEEFARVLHNEGAAVDRGQEQWEVKKVPVGAPAMWKNCIITSLQHRTGSVWQPEIYFPRG